MSIQTQGIIPTQVDPGTALGVGALFTPGLEVEDPRGGVFAGNTIKYVQSNTVASATAILAGDLVRLDFTVTAANRRFTVIQTTAAAVQVPEGIAITGVISPTNSNIAQFSWFWITVKGYVPNANVVTATAAGAILASSSTTAGRMQASPGAAADANAQSAGRRLFCLTLAASNLADVEIGG